MILNLTQHKATPDQIAAGVVEPSPDSKERIRKLITFDSLPSERELLYAASEVAMEAAEYFENNPDPNPSALIGGAPFFMSTLEAALTCEGINPLYAFSVRKSIEKRNPDGTVNKTAVFEHLGFVAAVDTTCYRDPELVEIDTYKDL